jgi:tetratricopeptide (TPR) repeat protein
MVDTRSVAEISPTAPRGAAMQGGTRRPLRTSVAARLAGTLVCLAVAASAVAGRGKVVVAPADLLSGAALGVDVRSPGLSLPERNVLAVSPEMRSFLDAHVERKAAEPLRLEQLVSAIIDPALFGLVYDDKTRTAAETFRARLGNCLSFSNMFVAMARDVGLDVKFQEVEVPPDWTFDKDTFVLNRHINVKVDLARAGTKVVDFNIGDFKTSYEMRVVSDMRAFAQYYNNIGVERMQAHDTAAALWCFREAIVDNDDQFSPAWVNLGTLYERSGHPAHAEAAFLQALEANSSDLVAMSNLSRLYARLGDRERAEYYQKKVIHHRWANPYYRWGLAREEYAAQRYDAAIGHLKYAIRKRPREDEFYFLLSLCYLRKGDTRAAERWLERAREVAASDSLKKRYSSKLDTLLNLGAKSQH